jgi:wyosine [tRNA(Phe)-imidazoG37] synthetase (radical SAM superfamily)
VAKNNLTFGPIPSRRFGISLGIDLSPDTKQCNFDCLYCELKSSKTIATQTNSPKVEDIISEVQKALKNYKNINVLTITANGEPTLYPYLDKLVDKLNDIKGDIKTLILTNSGNIEKKHIQQTLKKIDTVKLSLDCVSKKCFKKLDRVDTSVNCQNILNGIIEFRKIYKKELVCEVLFVKNLNDNDNEIKLLKKALEQINPNRIDIGTIHRPPAYDVKPVSLKKLQSIKDSFENLPVDITYKNRSKSTQSYTQTQIINLLKRRPLNNNDIDNLFDENSKEKLKKMIQDGIISLVTISEVEFYKIIEK